ncbi:Bug family tripartite tricarboxylate transporter substrate binding protein [Lampropedia aestuarii]|uniref:Bug family tripartite tricarboxylate transporter substrate binding protein n=1 Tax=Lampropedia aestuarii TaxID=2562762 RepID=UPI0024694C33|nr:tripartite tricarboxylate transporter substrate binding protein [Lampropedia aestuarii]MDH5858631.1 tripartite tricarboxylate transporter substrate binding protein [Lampropedia aestuarii]
MNTKFRALYQRTLAIAGAAALLAGMAWQKTAIASESAYPKQTITFVVPYAAGGSSDTRARQLAQRMSADLGVSVVIENKAGASGNIGTAHIAKATPDGYTIGLGNFAPMSVNAALYGNNMQFNPAKDLAPIALIERGAVVMAASSKSGLLNGQDLLASVSNDKHSWNYGSTGAGSASHLSTELLKQLTNLDAVHVPYKGGAPAINDLMAGTLDLYMDLPSLFMGYLADPNARMHALAVAAPERLKALPQVPTFAELGYPQMVAYNWFGVVAPAGTPAAIIERLNQSINKAMQDPSYQSLVESQGAEVGGGTPEDFRQFISAETDKWGALIRERNISLN